MNKEKSFAAKKVLAAKKAFVEKWIEDTEKRKSEINFESDDFYMKYKQSCMYETCLKILHEYLTLIDPEAD